MSKIYDNKEVSFLSGLENALNRSYRSDISVGYFNLRGWKKIARAINEYKGGEENQCRLLLGMYSANYQLKKELLEDESKLREPDNKLARKLKNQAVENFKKQLMLGVPSNEDENGLRLLAKQIREKKVIVKCFTRHPLHAKLYLTFNHKEFAEKIGFLGSSNLTLSGLEKQGELNIDVLDQSSCDYLCKWFEDKWQDQFSLDISEEIEKIIEESWAGETLYMPYHIYIKMAYHLSEDARKGLSDFFIPKELKDILFPFQSAAIRIATHHVMNKGGVLIGDVVGLGKTLQAVAIAKILEEENGWQTLILCPKNLERMWEDYRDKYGLRGRIMSISKVMYDLQELRRHHLVIIDESHNLRNPQGKRYKIIKDYIANNDSKCVLLSATPYNKTYSDLSSQLGLFLDSDQNIGIRPEKFLKEKEDSFQGNPSSLKAFEQSSHSEDWQQLMSLFLIRRTRTFIKEYYGNKDDTGYYLEIKGKKNYFPNRIAKTVKYSIDKQYRRFFSDEVVDMINDLELPRYALSKYKRPDLKNLTDKEKKLFKDLEQARSQPRGFCRINLFKTLESSGYSFLQAIQRHILRNCIFIYAIDSKDNLIVKDSGSDIITNAFDENEGDITGFSQEDNERTYFFTEFDNFYKKGKKAYDEYKRKGSKSIRWISSSYFTEELRKNLRQDTEKLIDLLKKSQKWNPKKDFKLKKLESLLRNECKEKKALIFTQYKDTAKYLENELKNRGIEKLNLVTGGMSNIQDSIHRFSPKSNDYGIKNENEEEIDILIATDILSEGQNLQDCHVVVNYDLPWAIIKLIQRVGRVDRIGQKSDKILCYSFMPDQELEKIINLQARVQRRLKENAEVIGTDESFFGGDRKIIIDLYNEKSEVLEKEVFSDIDLPSQALSVWEEAIKKDPALEEKIKNMPDVIHSTKEHSSLSDVLLFAKSHITNYLMQINEKGEVLTENQFKILETAKCQPETKPLEKRENHYEVVRNGLKSIEESIKSIDMIGRLGGTRNPRRKVSELLEKKENKDDILLQLQDDIFKYSLSNDSENTLKRMFRRKVSESEIISYIVEKDKNETLLNKKEEKRMDEKPRIVCSMGLVKK